MSAHLSPFEQIGSQSAFIPGITPPGEWTGDALWFLYQGDRLLVAQREPGPLPVQANAAALGVEPLRREYLGCWGEGAGALHCFSGELAEDAVLPAGLAVVDLRNLFGIWDERWVGLAGRAKQVAHWDRDHQFCSRCGAQTDPAAGERARRCGRCGLTSYPRISPAIIIAITRRGEEGEQILLARNHRFPPVATVWSLVLSRPGRRWRSAPYARCARR